MGKWIFRKTEPSNVQGVCVACNEKPQRKKHNKYLPLCGSCYKKLYGEGKKRKRSQSGLIKVPYRRFKKDTCSKCGFIPEHRCQLDVDHIDGNHKNDAPENLQTLCANCHRLKTHQEHLFNTLGD